MSATPASLSNSWVSESSSSGWEASGPAAGALGYDIGDGSSDIPVNGLEPEVNSGSKSESVSWPPESNSVSG